MKLTLAIPAAALILTTAATAMGLVGTSHLANAGPEAQFQISQSMQVEVPADDYFRGDGRSRAQHGSDTVTLTVFKSKTS